MRSQSIQNLKLRVLWILSYIQKLRLCTYDLSTGRQSQRQKPRATAEYAVSFPRVTKQSVAASSFLSLISSNLYTYLYLPLSSLHGYWQMSGPGLTKKCNSNPQAWEKLRRESFLLPPKLLCLAFKFNIISRPSVDLFSKLIAGSGTSLISRQVEVGKPIPGYRAQSSCELTWKWSQLLAVDFLS